MSVKKFRTVSALLFLIWELGVTNTSLENWTKLII